MIDVLVTGGTLDKVRRPFVTGVDDFREASCVPGLLRRQIADKIVHSVEVLMMIDSLDMTTEHRQKVLDACAKSDCDKIMITHGTDTMIETAQFIEEAELEKSIVLVGAMIPYRSGVISDAHRNLQFAIQALGSRHQNGVTIAMNNTEFNPYNVRKNHAKQKFETLSRVSRLRLGRSHSS